MELHSQDNAEILFIPLGGVGEIGMNCALYGFGQGRNRKWIMVDLGISFPDASLPGVDALLPDMSFAYSIKKDIMALFVTHAHEDHYGAILDFAYELDIPVYGTPFLKGMLYAKAEADRTAELPVFITVDPNSPIEMGDVVAQFIPVSHSIPEANSIYFQSKYGNVIHTGDWKLDANPVIGDVTSLAQFKSLGDEGIKAIIADSTNAGRGGLSPSEGDVIHGLQRVFEKAQKRVVITQFSSNIARIKSIYLAAEASGREVIVAGRALVRNITVAQELGLLDPDYRFLTDREFGNLPAEHVVILCTGSQGEPRAQMKKIADKAHPMITLSSKDVVVFSSRTIPGNEREIGAIQNQLVKQGIEIMTADDDLVHVSGHPRQGEILQLYQAVRPEYVIPVHGEAWHLDQHKRFALENGFKAAPICYNGSILKIAPGEPDIIGHVKHGRWCRDGRLRIDTQSQSIRARRKLSFSGIIFANILLDESNELMDEADLRMEGIPFDDELGISLEDVILNTIEGTIQSTPRPRRKDLEKLEDSIRRSIRNAINEYWGKKPICHVVVSKII